MNIHALNLRTLAMLDADSNKKALEMYMLIVEQYLEQEQKKIEKDFKCLNTGCNSKKVELWVGYCSYYGDTPPTDHTCGTQADNDYKNPKQANPADIKVCTNEVSLFEIGWLHNIEAPNVPNSQSLNKYDLHYRCKKCQHVTGDDIYVT